MSASTIRTLLLVLPGLAALAAPEQDGAPARSRAQVMQRPSVPLVYSRVEGEKHVYAGRTPRVSAMFRATGVELHVPEGKVSMVFPGAAEVKPAGESPSGPVVNYLLGDAPELWRSGIEGYGKLRYRELYDGIDLVFGGSDKFLKSEFIVAPRANPADIAVEYHGADSLEIDSEGRLQLHLARGLLTEDKPYAYQQIEGRAVEVQAEFVVTGERRIGFRVGAYDPEIPLVIDPVLSFTAFIGGSGIDAATGLALDTEGNAYVCGYTDSIDLLTTSPVQRTTAGGVDVFVAKFRAADASLVYLSYIGGRGDDRAFGIAVGSDGAPVVTGWTQSANFPVRNAFQGTLRGTRNAFLAKLNQEGSALVYSTFLGGSGSDYANGVAVDSAGNAIIAGEASSLNFPVRAALQSGRKGYLDAFVASFSAAGELQYSTFFGGSGEDRALAVATDATGGVIFAGGTFSKDLPVHNAVQGALAGGEDGFVAKFAAGQASLVFSTYIGGKNGSTSLPERVTAVAADAEANVLAAGMTNSYDFPVLRAYQPALAGGHDAFLSKFSGAGALVFSSYFGGKANDSASGVAVDIAGNPYITGKTESSIFPLEQPIQAEKSGGTEAFVSRWSPDGAALTFSSLLGGTASDANRAIAVRRFGYIWIAGQTTSNDFPAAPSAAGSASSTGEGFVARILMISGAAPVSVSPKSGAGAAQTFTFEYEHPVSHTEIYAVYGSIGNEQAGLASCSWKYEPASKMLYLVNDAATDYLPGAVVGSSSTLANRQCSVGVSGVSVNGSGGQLIVSLPVVFAPGFQGPKNITMAAQATPGTAPPEGVVKGSWTVMGPSNRTYGSAGSAEFIRTDSSTQGNWVGIYGANGYYIPNVYIKFATASLVWGSGKETSWGSATETRALQFSTRRVATAVSNAPWAALEMRFNSQQRLAIYFLDWQRTGRSQVVEVLDARTGALLDARSISQFSEGLYLVWSVSGHVLIRTTAQNPAASAVISGVFTDPPPVALALQ